MKPDLAQAGQACLLCIRGKGVLGAQHAIDQTKAHPSLDRLQTLKMQLQGKIWSTMEDLRVVDLNPGSSAAISKHLLQVSLRKNLIVGRSQPNLVQTARPGCCLRQYVHLLLHAPS